VACVGVESLASARQTPGRLRSLQVTAAARVNSESGVGRHVLLCGASALSAPAGRRPQAPSGPSPPPQLTGQSQWHACGTGGRAVAGSGRPACPRLGHSDRPIDPTRQSPTHGPGLRPGLCRRPAGAAVPGPARAGRAQWKMDMQVCARPLDSALPAQRTGHAGGTDRLAPAGHNITLDDSRT
jgi:hypothetical protein